MTSPSAMVVGATGMVGTRLVEYLIGNGWSVVGLCRQPRTDSNGIRYLSLDLSNIDECDDKLGGIHNISHVFYAARAKHGEGRTEPVEENLAMLRNVVEVVSASSSSLQHVHLVHGAKYYGSHLVTYGGDHLPWPVFYNAPNETHNILRHGPSGRVEVKRKMHLPPLPRFEASLGFPQPARSYLHHASREPHKTRDLYYVYRPVYRHTHQYCLDPVRGTVSR
jgi:nucleoside-diphosphate-sugar epimerase